MKEKTGKKGLSGYFFYPAAFLLPVGILLEIFRQGGFYPFGDKTLFIMDMQDQYLEFFAYLRYLFSGDNSLFFSWARSMGGNFLGLFAYYLASPLSFLTCFFPLEKMPEAILLLTVLKIGLCGVSFAVYADYLGRRRIGEKTVFWPVLLFSTSYALISYNMVYSSCLMWLDGVLLLPLVLLGVEKLLDGKRGLTLVLSLTALFLTNYYIGYMAGIFTGIYFLYRLFCGPGEREKKRFLLLGRRFGICTLLAIGFSAPLLLPALYDLGQGKLAEGAGYRFALEWNFTLADFLGKFRNGVYDSIMYQGLPSVYCGVAALVFAVVFFLYRGISKREKVGAGCVLGLLILSFSLKGLNLAWHGFQEPVWFPYRYGFLFSFFLLFMAVRGVWELKADFLAAEKGEFGGEAKAGDGKTPGTVWGDRTGKTVRTAIFAAMLLLTALDLRTNGQALFAGLEREFGYGTVDDYKYAIEKTKPLADMVREQDSGLYRVNMTYEYSKNDAMLFGFNGMTHYSSTYNTAVNNLTRRLGIAQSYIWNSGYGSTPLLDSLFAVSYRLSDRREPSCYERMAEEGAGVAVYRNPLALPMVYAASVSDLDPVLEGTDVYANQNLFLNAIAGRKEVYFREMEYRYEETKTGWIYRLTAVSEDPLYLHMGISGSGWADIYVNGIWVANYGSTETSCSVYLGSYGPGQEVTVQVERLQGDLKVSHETIARLDRELLEEVLDGLRAGGMEISSHKGGEVEGILSVEAGQKVLTSIPWDLGWSVRLDGKKVETERFAGTFLAVEVPAGEHELRFSYVSPGFYEGLGLFAAAAIAALFLFVRSRRPRLPGGKPKEAA